MKLKYRKGIFLVVFRKEKKKIFYLVLKRKLHWKGWEFPKGGVEKNESLLQAVKRELKEETGLKIKKIINMKINGKFDYPRKLKDMPGIKGMNYSLYAVEVKKGKVKIDKIEHSGYKWLDFKQAYKKLSFDNKKRCLKLVNKKLNQ